MYRKSPIFYSNREQATEHYVTRSLRAAKGRMVMAGIFFYFLSVLAFFLAGIPGVISASLQLVDAFDTDEGSRILIILLSSISAIIAVASGLTSFFVLRDQYKQAKAVYYRIAAELLLYRSRIGVYASSNPTWLLFEKVREIRGIKLPHAYEPGKAEGHAGK